MSFLYVSAVRFFFLPCALVSCFLMSGYFKKITSLINLVEQRQSKKVKREIRARVSYHVTGSLLNGGIVRSRLSRNQVWNSIWASPVSGGIQSLESSDAASYCAHQKETGIGSGNTSGTQGLWYGGQYLKWCPDCYVKYHPFSGHLQVLQILRILSF